MAWLPTRCNEVSIISSSYSKVKQEDEAAWKLTTIKKNLTCESLPYLFIKNKPVEMVFFIWKNGQKFILLWTVKCSEMVLWLWNLARLYMFLRNMYIPHLKSLPRLFLKIYQLKWFFYSKNFRKFTLCCSVNFTSIEISTWNYSCVH